jgi:uncharacterized protein YegL
MHPVDRRPDAWLFYLVCDVSGSMYHGPHLRTPWDAMAANLDNILERIRRSPTAQDIAHLSIVAFAQNVHVVLPLTWMGDPYIPVPVLPKGDTTDFGVVFDYLSEQVPEDYTRMERQFRVKRPAVYFITDGKPGTRDAAQPDEKWTVPLARLKSHRSRPIITALGLGEAQEPNLCRIAEPPGGAWMAIGDVTPADVLESIIREIIKSVASSSIGNDFLFSRPNGMRAAVCSA